MNPSPEATAAFVAWMTGEPTPAPEPDGPTPAQMFADVIDTALGTPAPTTQDDELVDLMAQIAADAAHTQKD